MKSIFHFFYWLLKAKESGYIKSKKDERDFDTKNLGWVGGSEKNRHEIKTLSIFDQSKLNICQWCATTVQKEVQEKTKLNLRLLVCKGKKSGHIVADGFSSLVSGQKVLKDWGIPEATVIYQGVSDWASFTSLNPDLYTYRAAKHKSSSYWCPSSRADRIKALNDDIVIVTAMDWYTGFNQGGGFKYPWIINRKIGYKVGGHAFVIIGYDIDKNVYICQNSYGSNWGDKGKFYIDMDYLDREAHGFYITIDEIDVETAKVLNNYAGKNVKRAGKPDIYLIQNGQKKPYPNMETLLSWNVDDGKFTEIDGNILDKIETGDSMDIKKTDFWGKLKNIEEAKRLQAVIELLYKK